jgi:hypothetical protein
MIGNSKVHTLNGSQNCPGNKEKVNCIKANTPNTLQLILKKIRCCPHVIPGPGVDGAPERIDLSKMPPIKPGKPGK